MDNKKTALVLAAGIPQAVLAEKLKKRGYRVIMLDYTVDPVGKYAADEYKCISTLDYDAVKKCAVEEKADLIMTVCTDQAMLTVSKVSEELSLPCYVSYKTGLEMTNKRYMKKIFAENAIPSAKYMITEDENCPLPDNFSYPLVIKPVDCNSSKGVIKVYNREQLNNALKDAIALSRTHNAVIEEYFEGSELSCDFIVIDGKVRLLTFSSSDKIKSDKKFVIYRSNYPLSYDTDEFRGKIEAIAQKIVNCYKLVNCPLLVQLLYNGKEFSVIEFSARTGGALKYRLIALTSGVDIIESTVDITLTGKTAINPIKSDKFVRNEFIYMKDGKFDSLSGFEELKCAGTIENYYLFHTKGFISTGANSSGDRIAGYTLVADSREEIIEKHNKAISNMKILSPDGEDLFRRDILTYEEK